MNYYMLFMNKPVFGFVGKGLDEIFQKKKKEKKKQ